MPHAHHRPTSVRAPALALAVAFALAACTDGPTTQTATTTSTTTAAAQLPPITQPGGQTLPPTTTAGPAITPDANRTLDAVGGNLTLEPDQRTCVALALSTNPQLVTELGDQPTASPRWPDLQQLASDCTTKTRFASQLATNIARQVPGATPEQAACLRDHFNQQFAPADVQAIQRAGLNPTGETDLATRITAWITSCGLQPPAPPSFELTTTTTR